MTTTPHWHATDEQTASLLDLLADDGSVSPSKEQEWADYVTCLQIVASHNPVPYVIDPNHLRRRVRGNVAPQRVGAFTRRAILEGLVEYTGNWVVSDDTEGKNAGKPCRELRWLGGVS